MWTDDQEIQDEDVSCITISDLDMMATYEILINLQQLFDQPGVQHGVPVVGRKC